MKKKDKLFPLGYEVGPYIDEAFRRLKETYPWARKDMFRKQWRYAIEKIDGKYHYVSYFSWSRKDIEKTVLDCDFEGFIEKIYDDNKDWIEDANEVIGSINVRPNGIGTIAGWYLEDYQFRKHRLGGYSSCVTAGNRSAGASRTFFIPEDYFKGTYEEFLDKYCELVPKGSFYLGKEHFIDNEELKKFLGFK